MNKPLILVVEDDPAVARLISTTLETRNYQYHRVQNGAGALLEAASARPDVKFCWTLACRIWTVLM